MAFDKDETKQLKDLFSEHDKRSDKIFLDVEKRINNNTDSKIDSKIENFAVIVNKSFIKMQETMQENTKQIINLVNKKVDDLSKKMDDGFVDTNCELSYLRKEVVDIRKKLSKIMTQEQYFELENRLTAVEEKLGIKY